MSVSYRNKCLKYYMVQDLLIPEPPSQPHSILVSASSTVLGYLCPYTSNEPIPKSVLQVFLLLQSE